MILQIFFILLLFTLICIGGGRYLDSPPLTLGGYTFLFLLGLTLMLGQVSYASGESEIKVYHYLVDNVTIKNVSVSSSDVYSNYSGEIVQGITLNHVFGFFICILSAFGFISQIMNLKTDEVFR